MNAVHQWFVADRRAQVLSRHLAGLIPAHARVLDVGCGDGRLSSLVASLRPDIELRGVEVLLRGSPAIPVEPYDGRQLPFADGEFDVVMLVDVLHHTDEPVAILREARRVARRAVVIKDHLCEGWMARPTLRFMDRVGNRRHGVSLPYNYLTLPQWRAAFTELGLSIEAWHTELNLYPWPARLVFERCLHFVARLAIDEAVGGGTREHTSNRV